MLRNLIRLALGASALVAVPAGAVTIVNGYSFDFTGGTATAVNGPSSSAGVTYTGTAADGSTITANVTAWNATQNSAGQYVLSQAYLGQYAGGLGVTSGANDTTSGTFFCGATGACGTQQIDNMGAGAGSSSIDFVRITFSTPVVLGSVSRNAAGITNGSWLGLTSGTDDEFSYGASATAITAGQTLTSLAGILGTNVGTVGGCVSGANGCNDTSTLATAAQASGMAASQNWYVGASIGTNYGGDNLVDAFKLTGVSAYSQSAVPEPGSWAMMILGFGGIGLVIRRHRSGIRRLMPTQ